MIHFKNLTEDEKEIANSFFEETIPYFESINQDIKFSKFMDLFNTILNERQFDKKQLKLFKTDISPNQKTIDFKDD